MGDSSVRTECSSKKFRIGMIGGGTVGGGVYEIISSDRLKKDDDPAVDIEITKICVRDTSKIRDFTIDCKTKLISSWEDIVEDDNIDCVIEVMGGTTLAREAVVKSLKMKKPVVTANKALIAEYLDELEELNKETKTIFLYEAAVCGGIPIIRILQDCYVGDVVYEISGILNGTTNFMLGKMEAGADYREVLAEAQALGFAEADPTADVEGHDVRAKIAILAKLAFGKTTSPSQIPCLGITNISSVDFEYAKLLGCTIKLIGTAKRLSQFGEHDGALSVYVTPKLVPLTHPLASAQGSGNIVTIKSANLGISSYTGPGAGRFPTANSIVADVYRIANQLSNPNPFPSNNKPSQIPKLDFDYFSCFYIRIAFQDTIGIVRKVGELAEIHSVSINSILQNTIKDRAAAFTVVTTEECKFSQVQSLCKDIEKQEWSRSFTFYMPIL